MFRKFFQLNPITTFYLVFAYILLFSLWWAYLLYEKNETAFIEKIELYKIAYQKENTTNNYTQSKEYKKIVDKYNRQKLMIIGEGSVFFILLLIGLLRVRKIFMQEIELVAQQRNFLLSITHELKSPLSAIKLSLQTLGKRKLEPAQSDKLIVNSLNDIERLDGLVDNILFAAKIERKESLVTESEINVSEILHSAADRFAQNKKKITINASIANNIYLQGDMLRLGSVIINLIENAIKYSPENSTINITLKEDAHHVYLTIADNGIGIPDKEKKKVFEKFYRIGNEDTRQTKGTGLGLYIVKRMVEIHGGEIKLYDNTPAGSIFALKFPKQNNT